MKKTVGIVDYGIGNHNSIRQSIKSLGFKSKITNNKEILQQCNLILLPGVGSFSTSINFLKKKNLDNFLIDQAGDVNYSKSTLASDKLLQNSFRKRL